MYYEKLVDVYGNQVVFLRDLRVKATIVVSVSVVVVVFLSLVVSLAVVLILAVLAMILEAMVFEIMTYQTFMKCDPDDLIVSQKYHQILI